MRKTSGGAAVLGILILALVALFNPFVIQAFFIKGKAALISLRNLILLLEVLLVIVAAVLLKHRRSDARLKRFMARHELAGNILLFCGVLLVGLILIEVMCALFMETPCLTYKGCPNVEYSIDNVEFSFEAHLNSDGFRDDDFRKDVGSVAGGQIAMIGDSMVFGWGVDEGETFVALVEDATGADVLNLGVEGTGVADYLDVLEQHGRDAETVVLTLFTGNDIILPKKGLKQYMTPSKMCSLNTCFLLYRVVSSSLSADERGVANPLTGTDLSQIDDIDRKYLDWAMEWKLNPYLIQGALEQPDLNARYEQSVDAFDSVLKNKEFLYRIIKEVEDRDGRLIVVLLPQGTAVSERYVDSLQELGYYSADVDALVCDTSLHSKIKRFLRYYSVETIDLQKTMCGDAAVDTYYFGFDGHLTPQGHEFVAKELLDALR